MFENTEVVNVVMNNPKLLQRKTTPIWPEGRGTYRFKEWVKGNVTIVGTSTFKKVSFNELD